MGPWSVKDGGGGGGRPHVACQVLKMPAVKLDIFAQYNIFAFFAQGPGCAKT